MRDNRVGTAGKPIRHVEVASLRTARLETRGPQVMLGLLEQPAKQRAVFTE